MEDVRSMARIIGNGESTIRSIREATGANVYNSDKGIIIKGTPDNRSKAKSMIEATLNVRKASVIFSFQLH